jgi:hypothetical protein
MKKRFIILVLLFASSVVYGQEGAAFKTAQQLRDNLVVAIRVQDSPDSFKNPQPDILTTLETSGYIMGCADAFNSDERYRGLVRKGVSGNELMRVVLKYLEAHPEKWRYNAPDEVFFAFAEAYHPQKK